MSKKALATPRGVALTTYTVPVRHKGKRFIRVYSLTRTAEKQFTAYAAKHGCTLQQMFELLEKGDGIQGDGYAKRPTRLEVKIKDPDIRRAVEKLAKLRGVTPEDFVQRSITRRLEYMYRDYWMRDIFVSPKTGDLVPAPKGLRDYAAMINA